MFIIYFKFSFICQIRRLSSSHGESSKNSSENGIYKIGDEIADEATDGPSTSGAEAASTSNTRGRSRRNLPQISDSESEEVSSSKSKNAVDTRKSKVK